jgi:uncharacterized protein YndB with AHSA1/START domain
MRGSVTVHIDATPADVWALVSDVTRIGEFSPETIGAEWIDGADGPAVGAKFRGHVKRNGIGPIYWNTCSVLDCVPEREFAFGVGSANKPLNVWRYHLEPTDDGAGTDVTESFALAGMPLLRLYWALWGWSRGRVNLRGMRTTLERIKAVVEKPQA